MESNSERLFYSIGEVADMFNVNASLIRFWEKEFDCLTPRKNKKGDRLFTTDDIEQIRLIYYLVKTKGYTLQGAKEHLKNDRASVLAKSHAIETLIRAKEILLQIKENLK
ncbi:MAG: MerR family transcriptional regulator [Bacteroidetes bacterium]|nr:MerR family transcriptional regulator [Bacteroidota bacterium]